MKLRVNNFWGQLTGNSKSMLDKKYLIMFFQDMVEQGQIPGRIWTRLCYIFGLH